MNDRMAQRYEPEGRVALVPFGSSTPSEARCHVYSSEPRRLVLCTAVSLDSVACSTVH